MSTIASKPVKGGKSRESPRTMRVLAVSNQKGGSGKTTTAVNLAAALGQSRRKVLLLDLDPQASASHWLGHKDAGREILDAFTEEAGSVLDLVRGTSGKGLELVASSSWLFGIDKALAGEVGAETLLHRQLEAAEQGRWDYVVIDCPPNLGILTVSALTAAREILVPVESHVMALSGLAQLMKTVELVQQRLNPGLRICGILPCRVDSRTRHSMEVVEHLRGRFGDLVFQTVIRENVRLAEAPSFGRSILDYAASSKGAEDYLALAREILAQEGRD
jgi:chromosome partitioning protein